MPRKLWNALVRGLVVVLPMALTFWLLWWLGTSIEALLHRAIVLVVPEQHYRPGMGIMAAVALLIAAGVLVNAFIVRRLLNAWEGLMERIPIVKSVYGAVRDFVRMLPTGGERNELRRVVLPDRWLHAVATPRAGRANRHPDRNRDATRAYRRDVGGPREALTPCPSLLVTPCSLRVTSSG
jgi:uncharacterized membrane protein